MNRNISDQIKAFLKQFVHTAASAGPAGERIESAKMSHTRLKALVRPAEMSKEWPSQVKETATRESKSLLTARIESAEKQLMANASGEHAALPPFVPGGSRLATVSQYRLAAYVATLPIEAQSEAAS